MNEITGKLINENYPDILIDLDETTLIENDRNFYSKLNDLDNKENTIATKIIGKKLNKNMTNQNVSNKFYKSKSSSIMSSNYDSQSSIASLASSSSASSTNPSSSLLYPSLSNSDNQLNDDENSQIKRRKYFESIIANTTLDAENIIDDDNDDDDNLLLNNMSINKDKKESNNFYGLPLKVKDLLKTLRGIDSLYDWQHELMTIMLEKYNTSLNQNLALTNLLYLSPTSGGKTLVAELLILHCLLVRNKNCIFIMPFVSIVQEKVELMEPFSENLNFYVEEYAGIKGSIPPIKRQKGKQKSTLYICTIEKAHSLVNSLIETDRILDEIGLVVADELHMIGDGSRGAIYEMILSKIKYCSKMAIQKSLDNISNNKLEDKNNKKVPNKNPTQFIQIVATTATLENKKEIAKFLDAYLYERNFRPVELKEYIKLNNQIFEVNKSKTADEDNFVELRREINLKDYTSQMKTADPDGLIALVKEIFDLDGPKESCLIFCSTKKNCENVATLLATHLPSEIKLYKRDLKLKLFNELREQNGNNICPVLRQSLQFGISYHHSGLTAEERILIEQAYKEGVLFLITCTSTLAAGVNLPAKRVIIRSPYVARDFISTHQYKQMIGRAGRAGLNKFGESILLFQSVDKLKVYDLISGPFKRCESSLQCDDFRAIRSLILSLIGINLTHFGFNILGFFKETLFFIQQHEILFDSSTDQSSKNFNKFAKLNAENQNLIQIPDQFKIVANVLSYLLKSKLIKIDNDENSIGINNSTTSNIDAKSDHQMSKCGGAGGGGGDDDGQDYDMRKLFFSSFNVTPLGTAAIKGNIDLDYVNQLYADLSLGLKNLVLSNYLHLLYLCTPYELVNSLTSVDFDAYANKYTNLTEDEIKCACIIGIHEDYIHKKRFQNKLNTKKVDENVLKRFYMTLIIYELWKNNKSIWKVSSDFQLDRGFVQQIIQSAASFSYGVLHFCENIDELWPYKNLLQELMRKLQYNCSSNELIPLLELDNVRLPRAQQLYNAGFKTIETIASSKPDDIADKIKNLPISVAKRLIKSANRILKEKVEILQAEAENLLRNINIG